MNRTDAGILALLAIEPMSGYDLKAMVDASLAHFWRTSYGSLYPALHRLEKAGLLDVSVETRAGGPDARVHALTPHGEAALEAWLGEPCPEDEVRSELLLKVFAGARLDSTTLRAHLEAERRRVRGGLARLRATGEQLRSDAAEHPHLPFWLLALDRGRRVLEARLAWAEDALLDLDAGAPEDTP
jgi:PadR family transcriptional regulator, regulatory protein AphA